MSILVLGGARSGKSRYAESLAGAEKFYIATAQAFDAEMQARIAAHRAQRGQGWQTFEAPLDVADQLQALDARGRFILIDCLTLWISNLMHAKRDVGAEVEKLCHMLELAKAKVVLVSNEVGQGIVPENALARAFRDQQGFANQRLAQSADEVVLVVAGLPMVLKKARRKSGSGKTTRS